MDTNGNIKVNMNNVYSPSHYSRWKELAGIEVIDITRHFDFNLGNNIKYVMRAGFKDGNSKLQDLLKAKWYLEDEINNVMGFKPEEPTEKPVTEDCGIFNLVTAYPWMRAKVNKVKYIDDKGEYKCALNIESDVATEEQIEKAVVAALDRLNKNFVEEGEAR